MQTLGKTIVASKAERFGLAVIVQAAIMFGSLAIFPGWLERLSHAVSYEGCAVLYWASVAALYWLSVLILGKPRK